MKLILTLLTALLLAPLAAHAQERQATSWITSAVSAPRVEFRTFQSKAAKTAVSFHAFAPEMYDTERERRFPVLYWLHGTGGGEKGIAPMAAFFDRAIREGKIPPMIVVFPNGMAASMWCDSKDGTVPMETVVTQELVPHIDASFRTLAKREARIVEGFSMGGYGAARLGFKYPQLFGAVSVLAGGPLDMDFAGPRATGNPAERERILNGTFGGDIDYFRSVHPISIATQQADAVRGKLRVRVAIGARDNTGPLNRAYSDHLTKLNIAHTFTVVPDVGHETLALLKGLGEDNWEFYSSALAPLATHHAAEAPSLWGDAKHVPAMKDSSVLDGVEFHVIKPYEFAKDGYRFLHGVALAWHKGKLYASFGHNQGGENTDTEEARFCTSADGGKTWSQVVTMGRGEEPGIGVSHGVFLLLNGRLWAFHGAYTGMMQNVHTRAYLLDDDTGRWSSQGKIIGGGFWPLGEPQKMADGNWIMAGISARGDAPAGGQHPAAVAISHGDDVTQWDLVVISLADHLGTVWGESAIIVDGKRVVNIARWGQEARALVAVSEDYGRTWTPSQASNLPMATSKPCAGTLSTGQRFLVCSTSADGGNRRTPLTIAMSRPGEMVFSRVFVIRHAENPGGPGESHPNAALAYPCAIEHQRKLYVGYSNSGGGVGRIGKGRELWNNNSAELAIIPLEKLKINP